jgi:tyrosyl-tRNA synthetase
MLHALPQNIVTTLTEAGLSCSRSEARRYVASGVVRVNGVQVRSVDHVVDRSLACEVAVGKRRSARLTALAFTESSTALR